MSGMSGMSGMSSMSNKSRIYSTISLQLQGKGYEESIQVRRRIPLGKKRAKIQ